MELEHVTSQYCSNPPMSRDVLKYDSVKENKKREN